MNLDRIRAMADGRHAIFRTREPLAAHLSIRIGGPPAFYLRPASWASAEGLLLDLWSEGCPFKILSGGTNLLASDRPMDFGVLHLRRLGGSARWSGTAVEADADVPLPALAAEAVKRSLGGLEGMAGIPGTVGGAAVMNAGAFGGDMARVLRRVGLVEPDRGLTWHDASEFTLGYRSTDIPSRGVVARVELELAPGDPAVLRAAFDAAKERRLATQPWREATAGSVFKNPEGDFAGRVLERLGFKGKRRGAAGFSDLHANFLVNHGGATFADAFGLCEDARKAAADAGTSLAYEMEVWT